MPRPTRRQAATATNNQSVIGFTRLSKSQAFPDGSIKKAVRFAEPSSSKKRKAQSIDDIGDSTLTRRNISFSPSSDEEEEYVLAKRTCRRSEPQPDFSAVKSLQLITKGKATAKSASSRTVKAHKPSESTILSKTKQQDNKVQTKINVTGNKLSSKRSSKAQQPSSGVTGQDLIRLHKAFLDTIMMQLAHTGRNNPVDFRVLAPHVTRNWGKRDVTINDISRCIAIQGSSRNGHSSPFIIRDYGRGKVCVEIDPSNGSETIDENRLCTQFEENLRELCAEKAVDEMADVDLPLGNLSLADLPQADIVSMDLGLNANPKLARGQRALSELKTGLAIKQQEKEAKHQVILANKNPMLNPDGTKMSVLDRLRMKQLAKANAPLPPSGPELQRRAALNRVADVAATISMLSLSNPLSLPRQAFTMVMIAEKLKDSLRVPISKEESISCVRIIASEVAPEWLRVVTIGGRDNVVVQRSSQPVDKIIKERVQKLLA